MHKSGPADYPTKFFKTQKDWEKWLQANHQTTPGIWIKFAKKDSGIVSTNYAEALDVALCYGWIDGQSKSIDHTYYMQKFTPRRAKSIWSQRNVGKTQELIAAGRMQPAGLAQIEAAKKDGRWDAAYGGSKAQVPPELQAALDKNPKAKAFFESLSATSRFPFYFRIQTAKRPETKQARVEAFIAMLEAGQKIK